MNNIVDSLMELGNVIILWLEDIFSVSKKTEQASSKKESYNNNDVRKSDIKQDGSMSMEDLFELFEKHGIGNDLSDSELENLYNLFSNTSSETLEIFFDALEESGIALEDISSDELLEIFEDSQLDPGENIAAPGKAQISFGGSCSHCDNDVKNTKWSWYVCKEN